MGNWGTGELGNWGTGELGKWEWRGISLRGLDLKAAWLVFLIDQF